MIVRTKAPTRIDLAGGTLDLWPIHQMIEGATTVNVGVTLHAEVTVKLSPDADFHFCSEDLGRKDSGRYISMTHSQALPIFAAVLRALWPADGPALSIISHATSPAGAGLGGSSCLIIALIRAVLEARHVLAGGEEYSLNDADLVSVASDIEANLIWAPTGVQDYWGAVRGRVNVLTFPPGRAEVNTLDPQKVVGLKEQLLLCYSGKSRASASNNWQVFRALMERDEFVTKTLTNIAAKAGECSRAIVEGDLSTALLISKNEWAERKKLWSDITTLETERIDSAALSAGAHFTRVCGAGGGGVIAVFVPPEKRLAVSHAILEHGGMPLDAEVAVNGLQCFQERS